MDNINRKLKTPKSLSLETIQTLGGSQWPGNIRQLLNLLERSAMLSKGPVLHPGDFELAMTDDRLSGDNRLPDPAVGFDIEQYLREARSRLIDKAIEIAAGNKSAAARLLGISPQAVHNHLYQDWVGSNQFKLFAMENTGTGDVLQGFAHSDTASGLHGRNTGLGPGVSGYNLGGGPGVYGYNEGTGHGVMGETSVAGKSGVFGQNLDGGPGVKGQNTATGEGVVGEATASNKSGVYGYNDSGFGVTGRSSNAWGMQAVGNDTSNADRLGDLILGGEKGEIFCFGHLGIYADNDVYIDLDDNDNDTAAKFVIFDGKNTFRLTVDEAGNLSATGTKSALVKTAEYGPRLLYAVESPGVWFEDLGSADLINGEATIAIEPIFADTVNLETEYHVFLTPVSKEPAVLYVTSKTSKAFTVRGVTLDGQAASCSFDYRVIARRKGYETTRLEVFDQPLSR